MNPDDFYTLEEVMYLFNKSKSTIIREANAGEIPYVLEPGKKRGKRYPKKAIDILVERKKKQGRTQPPRFVFSYSTIHDLWSEAEIGRHLYSNADLVPYATLLEWRDINKEMFMSLKDTGRVIAYASLMPLAESSILSLLEDKLRESALPLTAIQLWTHPQLSVYIASVTAQPTGNCVQDTLHSQMILRHTLRWALTMQHQYDIKNWYGIGATQKGQQLFEALGFTEIISLYDGTRKGYRLDKHMISTASIVRKMLAQMDTP